MIQLGKLFKDYGSGTSIGPVDLEIPPGGVTALVGPNGAGKSTLLTMMGRLLGPDAGTVVIGGHDVTTTHPRKLATVVSTLRQENHFTARLTVRQLVALGRFPYTRGRINREDERIISESIEFFDLGSLQNRYLDQLSGGQRQRAYVAMVLCQETDYLLLDEPLNNLDMRHSVHMMHHLRRVADELGRTVLIVLHDVNFASHYSDWICAVKEGKVVEFGTPEALMPDETLTRVFETPVACHDGPSGRLAVYY